MDTCRFDLFAMTKLKVCVCLCWCATRLMHELLKHFLNEFLEMLLKRALRTYKANFHSQTRKGGSRNLNLKSMCNSTPTIHSPISYESFLGKVNLKCFIRSIILTIIQNILFCILILSFIHYLFLSN